MALLMFFAVKEDNFLKKKKKACRKHISSPAQLQSSVKM